MQLGKADLTVQFGSSVTQLAGTHVRFSAHQCFLYDDGDEDRACLALIAAACRPHDRVAAAVDDGGRFLEYLLRHEPELSGRIACVTQPRAFGDAARRDRICGRAVVPPSEVTDHASAVLLADTRMFPRTQMRRLLGSTVPVIDLDLIGDTVPVVPARAWVPWSRNILYPIEVPEIAFETGLDVLLIDCPARNLGLLPNGLGYVHNALKHTGVRFQTLDLDIIVYHRFHVRRLFDEGGVVRLASGRELPTDPWQAEHYDFWTQADTLEIVNADLEEIAEKIAAARPRVLAMSIHSCNDAFSARVVERVRQVLPDLVVMVGGFACYNADIGFDAFPQADYMCIGEADLTVGELAERLAAGERPRNMPGVLSKHDDPSMPFIPAPMAHNLDLLDHPQYEWYDLDVYRNYNGYQLTPVIASRGCRWSRCTFCAERFYWRIRSAAAFVDELEWLVDQGCHLFMFNESDLNGMPEKLLEICDEIIRRKLSVKLAGQLRINKKSDRAFFQKLRQAGFVALRFGIDAFSENTLRLQKKGYTKASVAQNLRDCWEAGIGTEINWVIGVPGETDDDVTEGIEFILENQRYIARLANINPLVLVNGGVYWLEPEKHNIVFREPQEVLYERHKRGIPASLWYSTDPYIDEHVRRRRFERIVIALHKSGFGIGPWAAKLIEDALQAAGAAASNESEQGPGADGKTDQERPAGLSDGVGAMTEPEKGDEGLEYNPDARSAAYVFRAGSALPADRIAPVQKRLLFVRHDEELFAIEPDVLTDAFGPEVLDEQQPGRNQMVTSLRVLRTVGYKSRPEFARAVGTQNIVAFEGYFYSGPQGAGAIEWGVADLMAIPGTLRARTMRSIVRETKRALGIETSSRRQKPSAAGSKGAGIIPLRVALETTAVAPRLIASVVDYNVVEYEGWFYGLPQRLGKVDLAHTDVIEMPGVIRDLSRDVVEGEIRELHSRMATVE